MKVLLVIDHFGSGGAQRQIVELACGLRRRGHNVEMFVYFPGHDFFRGAIEGQGILVHECAKDQLGSLGVVGKLASVMRAGQFDVAVSFLSTANIYAELAGVAAPRTRLIVSERSSFHDDKSAAAALLRRLLHLLADRVVANSETQARWLKGKRWLRNKVSCIYNGVDLAKFSGEPTMSSPGRTLRLLGIGRVGPEKNLRNLMLGLARFGEQFGYVPEVSWAGSRNAGRAGLEYGERLDALLASLPTVQEHWHWLGLQSDVPALLRQHDALIHPSLYEGAPNAVCEALASGRPVLASDVCDHPLLVADAQRGFLFDPRDPGSIAAAIAMLAQVDNATWQSFGRNARAYALLELGIETMVGRYESLCGSLLAARER